MNNHTAKITLCEVGDAGPELDSYSPFCTKVHRALRVAGFDYERRHGNTPYDFEDLNPARQVPVLVVDDNPVADSTEICKVLDEMSGGRLYPTDPELRARALLVEELADTAINGFLVAARWADERNWPTVKEAFFAQMPESMRDIQCEPMRQGVVQSLIARDVWRAGPERCWQRYREVLDQLEALAPKTGYWLGDDLCVADVALFGQLQNLRAPLTQWQADEVNARTTLASYIDRVDNATRTPNRR